MAAFVQKALGIQAFVARRHRGRTFARYAMTPIPHNFPFSVTAILDILRPRFPIDIQGCMVKNEEQGGILRKRRTREHVIADLSVNHVEGYILRMGHSPERIAHDYGIDLLMFTYNKLGEIENGHVELQLKATDNLRVLKNSKTIACEIDMPHVKAWRWEPYPIILVVYDARGRGKAYWLYVQNYLESSGILYDLDDEQMRITFHIPADNRLNGRAIERFRKFRDTVLAQVKGVIRHNG